MNWVLTGVSTEVLAALAASVGASVVLMYALKVRRRRVSVPHAPLWQEVLDAHRPSRLWDRIKWLVGLLVHLLVLALLLAALGDPRRESETREGRTIVLLVDTSASMHTRDEQGARTRMERAREEARDVVSRLGPRDKLMVATVGGPLQPLTPFTDDRGLLDQTIASLDAHDTRADLDAGLRFALDALSSSARGEVVLVSDGAGASPPRVEIPSNVRVVHHAVGSRGDNVAIEAFNVRRYPANRTNYEVYARIRNHAEVPLTVELEIYGAGALLQTETIGLAAGAYATRVYPELPSSGRALEARVRVVGGDAVDLFDRDDVAHALLPDRRPLRVLLVTPGNLYLEAPLLLNASLDVTRIAPDAYVAPNGGDPSADFDVTVFDRVAPPVADVGNFLYFSPSGPNSPWEVRGDVVDPIIHSTRRGHPLVRWISGLRDVNIARARALRATDDDVVVASAIGGAPMILARETARQRSVGVAFDVADTDFPLRVAYPVLVLNTLDWFTRDAWSLVEGYATGETWFVPVGDRALTSAVAVSPSGARRDVVVQDGRAVVYGDEVGVYRIELGEREVLVAANLAAPSESSIAPVAPIDVPGVQVSEAFEAADEPPAVDPWMALVFVALALVLVEWWTWNRRVSV